MTNADVFIQIISEVSGRSKEDATETLRLFRQSHPGKDGFDKEQPDEKAEMLLAQLRPEKSGILNWLLAGRRRAEAKFARNST